eukprot:TRINITY_DN2615_c0_g1_i1.p2 TRINITY_DN2615_c0_g1~~TRINITY_DN2615_c0_g1_i1.p2  ORF type:complete len:157 (+),score=22.11 TRINITY_DN2615_c0_g1_i1:795-1265(+)
MELEVFVLGVVAIVAIVVSFLALVVHNENYRGVVRSESRVQLYEDNYKRDMPGGGRMMEIRSVCIGILVGIPVWSLITIMGYVQCSRGERVCLEEETGMTDLTVPLLMTIALNIMGVFAGADLLGCERGGGGRKSERHTVVIGFLREPMETTMVGN